DRSDNRGSGLVTLMRRLVKWLLSSWLGRTVVRSAVSATRIELFDRSMTVSAQLFTSLFPVLILLASWATRGDADWINEAVSMPEESRSILEDAVAAAGDTAFGLLGLVVVLASATGLSRALTRAFAAIWELPRPRTSLRSAWRWVAVILALVLTLLAVRWLGQLVGGLPPGGVWPAAVAMVADFAIALFVPWVLLSGVVRARLLLPGALIAALVNLAVRPAIAEWFANALDVSADRYGFIGVAFTYLALLYAVSLGFLATAVVGQVITTDGGRLGQWIRGNAQLVV
ncbi:MAG: YihY/virulence factor BrkB family protein, partial [Actinomycetota bacterium]|nr:YihY/virulence factor BrkB family protein [Actinomycetota bacterium]